MIRFRPLLVPTVWFVPALALLIGLGLWQIERLQWKRDLIARVESRVASPAVPLEQALTHGPAAAEWRHIVVRGRFAHDKELYVYAPSREGEAGLHVVTPLVRSDDSAVLVDRGFVPEALKDPATRSAGQIAGNVAVTGIVRGSQKPGMFTPKPEPARRLWFAKDAEDMATAADVRLIAPVIVEADTTPNPGGWPKGGQTRVDFRNDHLQYALTWFGLALVLAVIYLLYHRRQGRLDFGGR